MNLEHYEYDQLDEFTYRFYSVGRNGTFEMRVRFMEMAYSSYNLGFGVYDLQADELDDLVEVRNGDSQKISCYRRHCHIDIFGKSPKCPHLCTGSTEPRTRLYQMGINRILPRLKGYVIAGYLIERNWLETPKGNFPKLNGEWCAIELGVSYEAFYDL